MKLKVNLIVVSVLFLFFFGISLHGVRAVQVVKGPYLIYEGNNTQMTALWQLDSSSACTFEWGTTTAYTSGSVQTSEYGSDHQHKYVISNLSNATKYYYRLTVGTSTYTGNFLSAPTDTEQNLKFLAFGDTRTYPADFDAVAGEMVYTFTNDPAYQTLLLHVGDWVNSGDTESDWTNQFFPRSYANILSLQAQIPIQGCRGNHEGSGALLEKYYPYPIQSGGYYWSFDYGPIHVAVIDQYVSYSPGSAQYNWLENDLTSTSKSWIFLLFHEPGYSAGGHSNEADVQNYLQPLCTLYGVDIVFVGHNHYYSRAVVNGVQHVTTGGGGAPLYAPNQNADYIVAAEQVHHFCEIDIQGNSLSFLARDRNGNAIDSFSIIDDGSVTADFTYLANGLTVNFTDVSTADGTTITGWLWDFGDGNTSTQQNPTHTYATDGFYTVTLTVSDGGTNSDSISQEITAGTPPVTYCSSEGSNYSTEWIAGVQIGSFSNTSGASGYTDFTNLTVNLTAGQSFNVSLTPGYSKKSNTEYWSIWIDFNRDGDFDDPGEQVFLQGGAGTVTGSISIPSSASGTTRMRISMRRRTAPTSSCGSVDKGEVEDYEVSF